MKKVIIVLSIFVLALSSSSFAQNAAKPTSAKAKATTPKPGEAGYMQTKMETVLISSAQPKPATKPATTPKTIATPAPKPTPLLLPAVQKVREAAARIQS